MIVGALLSIVLGGVFLAGAIPKLRDPEGFMLSVLDYRVLPPSLGRLYAWLVPPLELCVALLVLTGTDVRSAATLMSLLVLSFITAVSINIARGRDLDCHCFGKAARRKVGWGLLLQDGALLGAAIALTTIAQGWVALEPWSVYRLSGLASAESLSPLLGCLALTMGVTAALRIPLRIPMFGERRHRHVRTGRLVETHEHVASLPLGGGPE